MNIFGYPGDTTLTSAGGVSLVADGSGPVLEVKGLAAGPGITLTPTASTVIIDGFGGATTLTSAGGDETLVVDGLGPALSIKGISPGPGIILTPDSDSVQIEVAPIFLRLDGTSSMAGHLDMDGHSIIDALLVAGPTYSRLADDILSNAGAGAAGNLPTFTNASGKVLQDSTVALSSLATVASLASYLLLAGGTMAGAINMAAHNITNVASLSGATNTRTADNIVSNAGVGVAGYLPTFADGSGKVLQNSNAALSSLATTTTTDGINSNLANVVPRGASDTWTNLNPANSTSMIVYAPQLSRMVGFDNSAVGISYSDDNGATWTVATGVPAAFLIAGWSGTVFAAIQSVGGPAAFTSPDGITWTAQAAPPFGAVNDVARMDFINGLFMVGTGSGVSGVMTSPNGVTWTARASTRSPYRFATDGTTIVGATQSGFIYSTNGTTWNNAANTFSSRSVVYSAERKEFIAVSDSTTTSYRSVDGIAWTAFANTLPAGVQQAIWVPHTARYYIAARDPTTLLYALWSSLDGITAFTSISTMQGATAVGVNFYDLFYIASLDRFYIISNSAPRIHYSTLSSILTIASSIYSAAPTGIDSASTVAVGSTSATAVNIGRTGITTQVSGTLGATQGLGSWYSTTTYNPAFSAGVNRLIPPTIATAGTLSLFTHALGVLTYTGSVTRTFRIAYNISFLLGASGANMTFFNSINGNLVIGTQARIFYQSHPSNNATRVCVSFSDNVMLALNDTVQLAASCALLSVAVAFDYVSCNIARCLE